MDFPLTLVNLAGAIALLLWGSHMVQTGVQRAFGPHLRAFLETALRSRLRALLAGLGVTALLQSSTATGLMTTGLAAEGVVDLTPALAVMLGANIGTTLVAQLFAFNVASLSPTLILVGVLMFRRESGGPARHFSGALRDLGRAFIGLGLMFLALSQLLDIMAQYEDTPSLRLIFGAVSTEPVVDVLLGAALTWAAHSSVAIVLFIQALASRGVVPPDAALALVIGANIGAAINPVLEGPSGDDPAARRLPMGNLLTRLTGGAIALSALYPLGRLMVTLQPDVSRVVIDFHTLFNLVVAAAFFPFLDPYAALLRRMLPDRVNPADPGAPLYLDASARETPLVALGAAARESLRLADLLGAMLADAKQAIEHSDRRLAVEARRRDAALRRLAPQIQGYLTGLDGEDLTARDQTRIREIMTFVAQIEQAGDVLSRSFLGHIVRTLKKAVAVDEPERGQIVAMLDRTAANLRAACSLLLTDDPRLARLAIEEKIVFREAEAQAAQRQYDAQRQFEAQRHFVAMAGEPQDKVRQRAQRLDLLRDLKTLNGHIVAAAAYPVLERHGELLPNRYAANRA